MKNKGTKQKSKKKGSENAFGCDLIEHLQSSGQDVPQVLKKCAEFIEKHGVVDGIYRLSGVTSNIQRLRQEFSSEACPDLTKEVYLQDIHCVGSLCKLYFRELPNPLLTYELYSQFTEAISVHGDLERLLHIQKAIKELPTPHLRTLEYLTKHLAHLATLSIETNMHTRNLALVWAPNLLRSKDIEGPAGNGDMAFQEVRKQQSVVEFILNHTDQIFSGDSLEIKPIEGPSLACGEKYATLPISGQGGPMKLMSLEEAQARSLSPNHPVHKERQRENSLPDTSTATLYHTVIDISEKRKFSGKSKRWKSIFNLGKDSKGKLSRNGSVFIRGQGIMEKAALRPSRSMESLCSLPADDDRGGSNSPADGSSGIFIQDVKSRTLGSDSLYDLSEHDQSWEFKGKKTGGARGGWSPGMNQKDSPGASAGASAAPQKALPEQLKVFKGDDLSSCKPTSPKNRRMLYSGSSQSSSSRPSFPGSFFPLESSPRHQRRAVNISEPFAVSVPLRVSAVISSNSTPCRVHSKDKAGSLKPCKEPSEQSSNSGKSNTLPKLEPRKQEGTEKTTPEALTSRRSPQDSTKEVMQDSQTERSLCELEAQSHTHMREDQVLPSSGEDVHQQPADTQLDDKSVTGKAVWSDLQELKITEPEIDLVDETFKPVFTSPSTCGNTTLSMDVKSKRSRSSPSLSLLCRENSSNTSLNEHVFVVGSGSKKKQPSESDLLFYPRNNSDSAITQNAQPADKLAGKQKPLQLKIPPVSKDDRTHSKQIQLSVKETSLDHAINHLTIEDAPQVTSFSGTDSTVRKSQKHGIPQEEMESCHDGAKRGVIAVMEPSQRLSVCVEEKRYTLELSHQDDEEGCGGNLEELELVESWEDLNSTNQWVTSPLHSPDVEEFFSHLSPFHSNGENLSSEVSPSANGNNRSLSKSTEDFSGNLSQSTSANPDPKTTIFPSLPTQISSNNNNITQQQTVKCNTTKQKNTVSSQRFNRQVPNEAAPSEKREGNYQSKHRPYSLNLDLGHRCIRDISNQQHRKSSEFSSSQRGLADSYGTVSKGHSELELFLNDRQAPLRRNSAPVSVSSVRTAFMIKTCQAKAVPVIPPKVQYSQIPQSRQENNSNTGKKQEKECAKVSAETCNAAPLSKISDLKEELENKKPGVKQQKHQSAEKSAESVKTSSPPELPVITRRQTPSLEVFVDVPRPNRGNVLQRPSFRSRQRPQSLILLSPPFPIMDYPPSGEDGKHLSSMKSLNETSAVNVFSKELGENFRTPEGIALQNKMTIPKSGQRLETSTSCFYQPQRRSMIFDSRSHRQIE